MLDRKNRSPRRHRRHVMRRIAIGVAGVILITIAATAVHRALTGPVRPYHGPPPPTARIHPSAAIILPPSNLPKLGQWRTAHLRKANLPRGVVPTRAEIIRLGGILRASARAEAKLAHPPIAWLRTLKRISNAAGIPNAHAYTCICPVAVTDPGRLADTTATVGSAINVLNAAMTAGKFLFGTNSALGAAGSGQAGTPEAMLTVPSPDFSTIIAMPGPVTPAPTYQSTAAMTPWVAHTFAATSNIPSAIQAARARRHAAYIAALQYGYGLAVEQSAGAGELAAATVATAKLGSGATAISQAGGLSTTAATLAAGAQHLAALEEASLEIDAGRGLVDTAPAVLANGSP